MEALVKSRLDRLDQSINDLVASVSAYNPSPAAAVAVIDADEALDDSLLQLSQHQRNFQVLQQLRTTTESLDSRIKTTLSSLAELRSELIKSTPLSLPSGQKAVRPVDANELLNFAQRIARSAPTSTQSGAQSQPELPVESVETQIKRESPAPPLPSGMDDTSVPGASGAGQPPPGTDQTTRTGRGKAIDALRPDYKQWLEQGSSQSIDVPWADQGMAMKSALNSLDKASPETDT